MEQSFWSAAMVSAMSSLITFRSSVLSSILAVGKSFSFSDASVCMSRVAGLSDAEQMGLGYV